MTPHAIVGTTLAAAWLAWGSPALAQGVPAPLAAQGCIGCHGPNGAGQSPVAPLAGRPAAELVAMLKAFRANEPAGTIMGRISRGYTDAEITAVAAFFAAQPR
ncbi:MAG: c-type cytochrome [Acetobacteraceae bacterium]|nr:c-type cytochrome [Acetobacteraceae bacterium]